MKTINIICVLQMLYFSINNVDVNGENIVLDVYNIRGTDKIDVSPTNLFNGGIQYVFKPKNYKNAFYLITYNNNLIHIEGKLKAKEIVLYRFRSSTLLKVPNPKHWFFNRKPEKFLYYTLIDNTWKNITKREYVYAFRMETANPITLDISGNDNFVKRNIKESKSTITYTPINDTIFILKVMQGNLDIWPQPNQIGAKFIKGKFISKDGISLFNVKYEDIDNKKKKSYHKLYGTRWVQLDKKGGKPLINEQGSNVFFQVNNRVDFASLKNNRFMGKYKNYNGRENKRKYRVMTFSNEA
ncbi:hypothetical protein BdWA1_003179 [Babesia duncani]|uniref:Uncharacterized protein n=1 Tax=Babesia duncani TaxID=323732 RepID=A0AAD9UMX1_9APIC|nr:hypothetical protein BdWA1_003179 [Babesia duncani]